MRHSKTRFGLATLTFLTCVSTTFAGQWFHLRVEDKDGETVKVNLPMALAESIIPLIEQTDLGIDLDREDIRIGHRRFRVAQLREIWETVKAEGNYSFVEIDGKDENVQVSVQDGNLLIQAQEGARKEVQVRVPTEVVDALFSGAGDELNIAAALLAMVNLNSQEFVSVRDEEATVRIWIDDRPGQ